MILILGNVLHVHSNSDEYKKSLMLEKIEPQRSHQREVDGKKYTWFVEDLWRLSSVLPIQTAEPSTVIDLDRDGWFASEKPTTRLILNHMKRILDADLSFPIILDPTGLIMDGAHRACKAILLNEETIRVVKFEEMPAPSKIEAY